LDASGRHGPSFGRLDSTRTPGLHTRSGTLRAFARAVVGTFQMLSAGDDNNCFLYKDGAHVKDDAHVSVVPARIARNFAKIEG